MTVVTLMAIHPKPGVKWEDFQKHHNLARKHGAENVTTMVGMGAGTATGTVTAGGTSADWTSYGRSRTPSWLTLRCRPLMADPNSPAARWDTYVSQMIPEHVTKFQTLPERIRAQAFGDLYRHRFNNA